MEEIWKYIKGYEGKYQISNQGIVKSLRNSHGKYRERILINYIGRKGYLSVVLSKDNKVKRYSTHRLVAETFIPNPDNKPQVNHINGIKTDNRICNLEWVTPSENIQHAYKTGLNKSRTGCRLSKDHKEKLRVAHKGKILTESHKNKIGKSNKGKNSIKVICITTNEIFDCIKQASNRYKTKDSNISLCCKDKRKSAGKLSDGTKLEWMYLDKYKGMLGKIDNCTRMLEGRGIDE